MGKSGSEFLFNLIAPIYGLFYDRQKKQFAEVIEGINNKLDLTSYETILDVGCGRSGSLVYLYFSLNILELIEIIVGKES
jgi:hypothetical protein